MIHPDISMIDSQLPQEKPVLLLTRKIHDV